MSATTAEASDHDLVRGILKLEPDSFAALVHRHLPVIYGVLKLRGLADADAREVAREVLLCCYTEMDRLDRLPTISTHFAALTSAEATRFARRRRPTSSYDLALVNPSGDPQHHAESVCRAAAFLSEGSLAAFFQRHQLGWSVAEIAARNSQTLDVAAASLAGAYATLLGLLTGRPTSKSCPAWRTAIVHAAAGLEAPSAAMITHLAACPACDAELGHHKQVFAAIPRAVERVCGERETLAAEILLASRAFMSPRSQSQWPGRWLWLAIALTLAALGLAIWGAVIGGRES